MAPEPRKWYVCYEALAKKVCAGPYLDYEVFSQADDIKLSGYASNVQIVYVVPDGYELLTPKKERINR